jgi:hypothetical protein
VGSTKKKASLPDVRNLTKRVATNMAKMVDDLTKLRKMTEEIKNKLDADHNEDAADQMYEFYNSIVRMESDIADSHYYFKEMYADMGGTDTIPDPCAG